MYTNRFKNGQSKNPRKPLGTITNSAVKSNHDCGCGIRKGSINKALGDHTSLNNTPKTERKKYSKKFRKISYDRLNAIRNIFINKGNRAMENGDDSLKHPMGYNRTASCKYAKVSEVWLKHSKSNNRSYFEGVMTCGSVWSCPVCSQNIQSQRVCEINTLMRWVYSTGKTACLVTYTIPHYYDQNLESVLKGFLESIRKMKSYTAYKKWKRNYGVLDSVRATEVTFGQNGWHVHAHEIFILDRKVENEDDFKSDLFKGYQQGVLKCSQDNRVVLSDSEYGSRRESFKYIRLDKYNKKQMDSFKEHGLDVIFNARTSDYLTKIERSMDEHENAQSILDAHKGSNGKRWGIEREIVKSAGKNSKGFHPFQLIDLYIKYRELYKSGDDRRRSEYYDNMCWLGDKFDEYSTCFSGRRQLIWSRGLKKKCGVENVSDIEAAEEENSVDDSVYSLCLDEVWDAIREVPGALSIILSENERCNENCSHLSIDFVLKLLE